MLLGGAIGAFITYTVIRSMDALGPAKAVMLIVVAQLAVAYIIELFGWFGVEKQPWEWRKAIGMAVASVGIVIFLWKWSIPCDSSTMKVNSIERQSPEIL